MTERTPLQEALEALRPFKGIYDALARNDSDMASTADSEQWEGVSDAENNADVYITIGDLRRAAAAFDSVSTHLKGDGDG